MKQYFFDQDQSCHWYIIESDKREEWDKWCALDEDDEASWETPEFAKPVGGCISGVVFYLDFDLEVFE